jgi:MoCo/4Fe-4S cofactor protein with predicted Tat translocation signal
MATAKKYWKGIGEINNEVSTAELAATEFNEALPTADF